MGLHHTLITDTQRQFAANGNAEAFWIDRQAAGDPIANIALDSINPTGSLYSHLFGGDAVNSRLEAFSRVYTGNSINIEAVRIDLMNAHIFAIDADSTGHIGSLSPIDVTTYHQDVFSDYGLPSTAFGGTPFTGGNIDTLLTAPLWCGGCDSATNPASGGFVLYPNKINTNQIQSVYSK